jgi:xylan 1,4-beta-xylosidase
MDQRVCRAITKVRNQMKSAGNPTVPLFWTEWNVPGHDESRDTTYVGPAVANTIRQCDGLVDMMSFWTFSDVFEEGGPGPRPFVGQFGLRAEFGINKPSYYGFALLHQLGDKRIANSSPNIIVTKSADGHHIAAGTSSILPAILSKAHQNHLSPSATQQRTPPSSASTTNTATCSPNTPR